MFVYPPELVRLYHQYASYRTLKMIAQLREDIAELEELGQGEQAEPLRRAVRELEEMQCTHKATHQT